MEKLKEHYKLFFLLLILILLNNISVLSQVTIGSTLKPNEGSLLDIKEHNPDENNVTASKGLLLPRVTLLKLEGSLSETLGVSEVYPNEEHIGLIVYNIADSICPTYISGVYAWRGSSWLQLFDAPPADNYSYIENSDGTGIVTDYEGNPYSTKRFKITLPGNTEYNQVWMTQNLRSLKTSEGLWINCPEGLYFNPGRTSSMGANVNLAIPDSVITTYVNAGDTIANQLYSDYLTEFGMLYNNEQAVKACPKGWHLPTYTEWENLLNAFGGATTIGHSIKANSGKIYRSVEGASFTWGTANAEPNGFNVVPAGYVDPASFGARYFGRYTGFNGVNSIVVIHHNSEVVTLTERNNSTFYYSVRCIKD